jgi:hypothetical protein
MKANTAKNGTLWNTMEHLVSKMEHYGTSWNIWPQKWNILEHDGTF